MNRPWVIWIVLLGCALLIVGAMGLLTDRILGMEAERARVGADGEIEERVRLGLSRMDAAGSSLLVLENQRPPLHFEAFYSPEDILTNAYQNVSKSLVLRPSPLLSEPLEFVRLHFEMRPGQVLSSPQVPLGNQRDLAESSGVSSDELNRAASDLESLRTMFAAACPVPTGAETQTNYDLLILACEPAVASWNWVEEAQVAQKSAWMADQRQVVGNSLVREQAEYQQDLSYIEWGQRAKAQEQTQERAAQNAMKIGKVGPNRNRVAQIKEADAAPTDAAEVVGAELAAAEGSELREEITAFRPVWLGDDLFAVRRVLDESGPRYQGIWLRAGELKTSLLDGVSDLLPEADLIKLEALTVVANSLEHSLEGAFRINLNTLLAEPRALVTLPWRLEVGEVAVVVPLAWTPLRISLLIGWVAVVLALLAASALVRGVMKMSARRAAFVSSVTHELRTPLTTFQLYSDLLASGMIQEESKRQSYLDTLCLEAGRLNHLIENVLAYSRIERGSARAKHETLTVASLLERFERRVRERVEQEGATLRVVCAGDCAETSLDTDVTAVEQIVFNLVDNACKYGMAKEGGGEVLLKAELQGGKVRLAVCDQGGGIERKDLKKLFRPFHKSAKEAAHSKPGVGLGLALSRRLARALGGELTVESRKMAGACFVLELKAGPLGGRA